MPLVYRAIGRPEWQLTPTQVPTATRSHLRHADLLHDVQGTEALVADQHRLAEAALPNQLDPLIVPHSRRELWELRLRWWVPVGVRRRQKTGRTHGDMVFWEEGVS